MRANANDVAISDIAGTLLLVLGVVLAGGALTGVVATNLSREGAPIVSLSLAPLLAGDATLTLVHQGGETLTLDRTGIALLRDGVPVDLPRSAWGTPDPLTWGPGERLALALSPPLAAGERVEVRVAATDADGLLATLSAAAGAIATGLGDATLVTNLTPGSIIADGTTAARLTVRVSHRAGSGAIARVVVDLTNLTNASRGANATLDLSDAGLEGDEVGGDGVYSVLVRAPASAAPGSYDLTLRATDLSGRPAGAALVLLNVTSNLTGLGGGGYGSTGFGGAADPGGGVIVNGTCYGCVVSGGVSSYEGTRLTVPPSANLTVFRLRNWTWDHLDPEKLTDDAGVVRVLNATQAWSMYFRFGYIGNKPCMTYARAWTGSNQTEYAPRNGTCLPLEGLDLDLIDPVASEQLVVTSGIANPGALYKAAGITGKPTFILAYLRDEDPTGQKEVAESIGIYSTDVVMR